MTNATYQDYLNTDQWDKLRKKVYCEANNTCELCGNPAAAVHHIRYPKTFEQDRLANLIAVCDKCHERLHGKNAELVTVDKSEYLLMREHLTFLVLRIRRRYKELTHRLKMVSMAIDETQDTDGFDYTGELLQLEFNYLQEEQDRIEHMGVLGVRVEIP